VKNKKKVSVSALIKLPDEENNIKISRSLDSADTLVYDKKYEKIISPLMSLAESGQYVLTRKDILKFIAVEAGRRSEEIQALMDITDIETLRKCFVKVKNDCLKQHEINESLVNKDKSSILAIVGDASFDENKIRAFVNTNRSTLKLKPITNLFEEDILAGTNTSNKENEKKKINVDILIKQVSDLNNIKEKYLTEVNNSYKFAKEKINYLKSKPELLHSIKQLELVNKGLELLGDENNCPLCDKEWEKGKLKKYIIMKKQKAVEAEQNLQEIHNKQNEIVDKLSPFFQIIQGIHNKSKLIGKDDLLTLTNKNKIIINEFISLLKKKSLDEFPEEKKYETQIKNFFYDDENKQEFENYIKEITKLFPKETKEKTALDLLTRLDENFKSLKKMIVLSKNSELIAKRAEKLHNLYNKSKEIVLTKLYDGIKGNFVKLYKNLHIDDEGTFSAKFIPNKTGLNLEVDFHGRGTYPPLAFHSEGHQDSMGICLYLSLADKLIAGKIELIVLDDVVMSIDSGHRKQLCKLLNTSFPNKQFFITTHDRAWANQLCYQKVVKSKSMIEFYNWSLETGPKINYLGDSWKQIEKDLVEEQVSDAAAKLRKSSEEFFLTVCQSLRAKIICKPTLNWDLGDLLHPAMGKYNEIIKKAKASANSWNNVGLKEELIELGSIKEQIYKRVAGEQWALNPSVHYNDWQNFTSKEFRDVVNAFKDLFSIFQCSKCQSFIKVIGAKHEEDTLKCDCGKINLNLKIKR